MKIFFRKFSNNVFSVPVLLNSIENLFHNINFSYFSTFDELINLTSSCNEILYICYSFMTTDADVVYHEIKQIKNILKNKKYLLLGGGSHLNGDKTNHFDFDYIFLNYSEETFPYFLKDFSSNSSDYLNNKYIKKDKFIYPVKDVCLDSSFPLTSHINTYPPLEIMRGCKWECNFCQTGILNKTIQMRNLDSIDKYLKVLSDKNLGRVNFISPNAFDFELTGYSSYESIEKLLSLCNDYKFTNIEYGIFPSEIRPESITDDKMKLMKKYCKNRKITIGGQSGNNKMLKIINRTHTIEDIINSVKIISQNEFIPKIDFILGFPEETAEDRKDLIELIYMLYKDYSAQIHTHYFIPLPGTPFYFKNPTAIDFDTEYKLKKMYQDGIVSNWWKKGIELSNKVVIFRDSLNSPIN